MKKIRVAPNLATSSMFFMVPHCGLCGHEVSFECGSASVWEDGWRIDLCHAESHDCYVKWTVEGERPPGYEGQTRPWRFERYLGSENEHSESEGNA